ncbi:MAG: arsenate reductase [Omnitrophica bacterium GWA2_52_8]|nr:MAG: arsenate reductase [Omnitrophica bacterium GWA2_52_8]
MPSLTIYEKPTCTTCREVHKVLTESGVDFSAVNYYVEPLSKSKLKELLTKMGMPAAALLRQKEEIYKKLKLSEKKLTEEQVLDYMIKYPDLIQRPIAEKGAKAILARPAEKIKELL